MSSGPKDDGRLAGKIALVTGAASGIGEATALALAAAGATVAVVDRDEAGAKRTVAAIEQRGGRGSAHPIDLSEIPAIPGLVADVLASHGRIDLLVNAAGISGDQGELLEVSEANWDAVQTVNLKAPFRMIQEVARHMVERGGGGRIVNVTSSSAHRARRSGAAYGSAKAGLAQLTRTAAADLGAHDINVNAVAPGVTVTPMLSSIGDESEIQKLVDSGPLANLLGRPSRPEDLAETIVFLCLPGSRQITGQTIHVSAGAVTV